MEQLDIIERIHELEREIALLPPGSIAVKKVKGKEYYRGHRRVYPIWRHHEHGRRQLQ